MQSGHGKRLYLNEVSTRDGFQMESRFIPTDDKVDFINRLSDLGYAKIEVTSFTSAKAIPALQDGEAVMQRVARRLGYDTGLNLDGLIAAAAELEQLVEHALPAQVSRAGHRLTRHAPPPDFAAILSRAHERDILEAQP